MSKKAAPAGNSSKATTKSKTKDAQNANAKNPATTETTTNTNESVGENKVAETTVATEAPKKLTIKVVPKKVRQSGGGTRSAAITYNIGTCPYNMLVTKTNKETKEQDTQHLRHILNGSWVPTFNGMEGLEVNADLPVYESIEEAFAANPDNIGFGVSTQGDGAAYPKIFRFKSNIDNIAITGEEPAAGQPDKRIAKLIGTLTSQAPKNALTLALSKGKDEGETWRWHGHIQATAENAAQVAKNLKAYMESPYADKDIVSSLTLLPAPWALSSGAAPTVGAPTVAELV